MSATYSLSEILQLAEEIEKNGYQFYTQAAQATEDKRAQEVMLKTEAEAGSEGGIAVTPVAGISVAVNRTEAVLEAGDKLDIEGSFKASASHVGETTTKAEGQAEGESQTKNHSQGQSKTESQNQT